MSLKKTMIFRMTQTVGARTQACADGSEEGLLHANRKDPGVPKPMRFTKMPTLMAWLRRAALFITIDAKGNNANGMSSLLLVYSRTRALTRSTPQEGQRDGVHRASIRG